MEMQRKSTSMGCSNCRDLEQLDVKFSMAFQPIINLSKKAIYGYEALVRGMNGESAEHILSHITDLNRYKFDQAFRIKALRLAKKLNLEGMLSINFFPNAIYQPEVCIRATLETAAELNFPTQRIMFEVTEGEEIVDHEHLNRIFDEYKKQKFTTAIDDFGAGYAGLNRLVDCQPDVIKLDMSLTRNIYKDHVRKSLVLGIIDVCKALSIEIIAEGIESREERNFLHAAGINLFQGFYFAKPGFENLPSLDKKSFV